jgi:DNA primase
MIESIPDGAFRDRMFEMLAEKTTLKWSLSATLPQSVEEKSREMMDERVAALRAPRAEARPEPVAAPRPRGAEQGGAHRSVVRSMVALLVQQPRLVEALEPPYLFGALRQPGIPLLMELIALCRARPGIADRRPARTLRGPRGAGVAAQAGADAVSGRA